MSPGNERVCVRPAMWMLGLPAAAALCLTAATPFFPFLVVGLVPLFFLWLRSRRRCAPAMRPVERILREVDRLDAEEAPDPAYQPLFDELVLHVAAGGDPLLERETVRRMNAAEAASRRMFLQLAAVHPRLEGELRRLAGSVHPLAPEAKQLLRRKERGDLNRLS